MTYLVVSLGSIFVYLILSEIVSKTLEYNKKQRELEIRIIANKLIDESDNRHFNFNHKDINRKLDELEGKVELLLLDNVKEESPKREDERCGC